MWTAADVNRVKMNTSILKWSISMPLDHKMNGIQVKITMEKRQVQSGIRRQWAFFPEKSTKWKYKLFPMFKGLRFYYIIHSYFLPHFSQGKQVKVK